jgi:hypothetical protein
MKKAWLMVLFLGVGFVLLAQTTTVPSISWAYGDTFDTLKRRNPSITFKDTSIGDLAKEYTVIEGQKPIITDTRFIFGLDGRLATIIYRKVGAALDVYEPLFNKYKTIYGSPKENSELGLNQYQSSLNGFPVFTGDSEFESTRGGVTLLIVVPSNNINFPYVFLIESYKYQEH